MFITLGRPSDAGKGNVEMFITLEILSDACKGMLRREIPMAWGTTTDSYTPEINLSQYAIETKYLTLKDRTSYLILDG